MGGGGGGRSCGAEREGDGVEKAEADAVGAARDVDIEEDDGKDDEEEDGMDDDDDDDGADDEREDDVDTGAEALTKLSEKNGFENAAFGNGGTRIGGAE